MAITSRAVRVDITDEDNAGALNLDVHYELTSDNPEAILMGAQKRFVVVRMEALPRGGALNDVVSLINKGLIVDSGGWPEAALPLPRPRKP